MALPPITGSAHTLDMLAGGRLHHSWVPECTWECVIEANDWATATDQTLTLTFATDATTDGTLRLTFTGGNLAAAVVVDVAVSAGDSDSDIAAAAELAIDGEGDLDDTIASTTDTAADLAIVMETGVGRVFVSSTWIPDYQTWTVQFGGTIVDGNYDTTLTFTGIDPITVRTARAGGTPADEAALAVQHETDIEADARLFGLVASADDDGTDLCTIVTESGVTTLTVTCSAPGTATLTPVETTGEVTVTQADAITITLNTLHPQRKFPTNVIRYPKPNAIVTTAFAAGTTLDMGDDDIDGVLAGVDVSTTGTKTDSGTAEGDGCLAELAWAPTATLTVTDATATIAGRVILAVDFRPLGTMG